MTASEKLRPFANTPEFYYALGRFFAAWSRAELAIDCAIWKARGTHTAEEAHARSARMKFSDRCKELRDLLDAGKLSDGEKLKEFTGANREGFVSERLRAFDFGVRRTQGDIHPATVGAVE
jgi:hypothetical protein